MYLIETFEDDMGKNYNVVPCVRLFFTSSDAKNAYGVIEANEVKNIRYEKINFFHAIVKYPHAMRICFSNFLFEIVHGEEDF